MGILDTPVIPKDVTGRKLSTFEVADIALRRRDMPGLGALPTLMASPPTATLGAKGDPTTITGSALVPPWDTSAFTYFGTHPAYGGTSYPGSSYFTSAGASGVVGVYPSGKTTASPWAVEFILDTTDGLFEISTLGKGTGGGIRVLVNGQYATIAPTFQPPSDGSPYLAKVALAGAGTYRIRLELEGQTSFGGIRTIPTNGVTAAPRRTQRWIFPGDSFTEPTISDTGPKFQWDGYVQQLSYLLGVDAWSAGSGGTGFLNPNSGAGRVKLRDRIADITGNNPDVVVVAMGINDYANYTAAQVGAEALATFQAVMSALPRVRLIVLSPWWPRGPQAYASNLLATADAIKASAAQVGAQWIDTLRLPAPTQGANGGPAPASTTLAADVAVGATQITTPVSIPLGTWMQISQGSNAEVRRVSGVSGSGPYVSQFGGALPSGGGGNLGQAHATGETVTPIGPGIVSGSGIQGTPTGDGTSERYTGSDNTHPTVAGHRNIAKAVYRLIAQASKP